MTGGILALDVATTTGWAYGLPGARPQWGHFRAGKPGTPSGAIAAAFRTWLDDRCEEWQPRAVVFESPYVPEVTPRRVRTTQGRAVWTMPGGQPPININTLRRLITLCGLVEMTAAERRLVCREEAPNVICRHFTGHGSWGGRAAKKAATIKMCQVYGWATSDDNEADALALWVYAEAALAPRHAARRGAGPLFARAG